MGSSCSATTNASQHTTPRRGEAPTPTRRHYRCSGTLSGEQFKGTIEERTRRANSIVRAMGDDDMFDCNAPSEIESEMPIAPPQTPSPMVASLQTNRVGALTHRNGEPPSLLDQLDQNDGASNTGDQIAALWNPTSIVVEGHQRKCRRTLRSPSVSTGAPSPKEVSATRGPPSGSGLIDPGFSSVSSNPYMLDSRKMSPSSTPNGGGNHLFVTIPNAFQQHKHRYPANEDLGFNDSTTTQGGRCAANNDHDRHSDSHDLMMDTDSTLLGDLMPNDDDETYNNANTKNNMEEGSRSPLLILQNVPPTQRGDGKQGVGQEKDGCQADQKLCTVNGEAADHSNFIVSSS